VRRAFGQARPASGTSTRERTPGARTFTFPPGVDGTSAQVVGENRTIPVANGTFSDAFAQEYAYHVYKIALAG